MAGASLTSRPLRVTALLYLAACVSVSPLPQRAVVEQGIPVTGRWGAIGPGGGGGKHSAAISPVDADVAIVTSDVGGIFRTADGGRSWTIHNHPFVTPKAGRLYSLAADVQFAPTDPNYVLVGPYLSTDYGLTFSRAGAIENDHTTVAATFHARTRDVRYVAPIERNSTSRSELVRFDGSTRTLLSTLGPCSGGKQLRVQSLIVWSRDPSVIWAATNCGLWRSSDSGESFDPAAPRGLPSGGAKGVNKLVQLPGGVLVAALTTDGYAPDGRVDPIKLVSPAAPWDGGIYYTRDGVTWTDASGVTESPANTNPGFDGAILGAGGWNATRDPGSTVGQVCTGRSCRLVLENPRARKTNVASLVSNPIALLPERRFRLSANVQVLRDDAADSDHAVAFLVDWLGDAVGRAPAIRRDVLLTLNRRDATRTRHFEVDAIPPAGATHARISASTYDDDAHVEIDDFALSPTRALPRSADYTELVSDGLGNIYTGVWTGVRLPDGNGVYRSTDQGVSWSKVVREENVTRRRAAERGRRSGFEVGSLAMGSGAGNQTLYFGTGLWLYKTSDAGASWIESNSTWNGVTPDGDEYRGAFNDIGIRSIALDVRKRDRLYYGDEDNALLVASDLDDPNTTASAPNFQLRFPPIVIADTGPVSADSATSIVLDPNDPNHLFVGLAQRDRLNASSRPSGVAEVWLTGGRWSDWRRLSPLPVTENPGIQMVLTNPAPPATKMLYVAAFGRGVFRRDAYGGSRDAAPPWVHLDATRADWGSHLPAGWIANRIAQSPANGQIFVGFGHPDVACGWKVPDAACPEDGTGVWTMDTEAAGKPTFTKIFPPTSEWEWDYEPVTALHAVGAGTLYVGTRHRKDGYGNRGGGLYKGTCASSCTAPASWIWTQKIPTESGQVANVTGIAASPRSQRTLYAFVSHNHTPFDNPNAAMTGLWMSRDAGETWSYVKSSATEPLMSLSGALLAAWPADPVATDEPLSLYVGTNGTGLFQGSVTCDPPDPDQPEHPMYGDFDSDGVNNWCDDCPLVGNGDQADSDDDGVGDACEGGGTDGAGPRAE